MRPKEKAQELFDKFNKPDTTHYPYVHNAQQCALIAVDEILDVITSIYDYDFEKLNPFWEEVKQEINNL
jgi:Mg/Co/Ni transporter MgtE